MMMVDQIPIDGGQKKSSPLPLTRREKKRLYDQHNEWMKHIIAHALGGIILGAMVAASLLWFDINRIGTIVFHSSSPGIFILLMIAGFSSTIGMAAAGTAIYFKSTDSKD